VRLLRRKLARIAGDRRELGLQVAGDVHHQRPVAASRTMPALFGHSPSSPFKGSRPFASSNPSPSMSSSLLNASGFVPPRELVALGEPIPVGAPRLGTRLHACHGQRRPACSLETDPVAVGPAGNDGGVVVAGRVAGQRGIKEYACPFGVLWRHCLNRRISRDKSAAVARRFRPGMTQPRSLAEELGHASRSNAPSHAGLPEGHD
jgi:hypothetical protein